MTATLPEPDLDKVTVGTRKVEITCPIYAASKMRVDSGSGVIDVVKVVVCDYGDRGRIIFYGKVPGLYQRGFRSPAWALYGYRDPTARGDRRRALPWMVDLARRLGYTGPIDVAPITDEDCEGS